MSNQILKHSLNYSIAQFFIMFAGLISFPILTKNLSPEDYGIIGLFTISASFISSLNKFGIQHSILRFRENYQQNIFISNILYLCTLGPLLLTAVLLAGCYLWFQFVPENELSLSTVLILLFVAYTEAMRAIFINILISKQLSGSVAKLKIISKTANIIMTLFAVVAIASTADSFIYAVLVSEIVISIIAVQWIYKLQLCTGVKLTLIDRKIYLPILTFAIPLLGLEIVSLLHAFIDRYLIKSLMESKFLGFYSAYYNMAKMVAELIIGGVILAIVPAYMKLWKQSGKQHTEALMNKAINLFVFIYPMLVAGLYAISSELFTLLTTPEYAHHHLLLPIIAAGVLLNAANPIFSAGLKLEKKVMVMFWCVLISTVLNFILNLVFIPYYGLPAAAVATTVSYSLIAVLFYYYGQKTLKLTLNYGLFLRSCLYCLIFAYLCQFIEFEQNILQLVVKLVIGVSYFAVLIFLFEKPMFNYLTETLLSKLNKKMKHKSKAH